MNEESTISAVSVRAWLALLLVGTACLITLADAISKIYVGIETKTMPDLKMSDMYWSSVMFALGFFFGQKTTPTK